MKYKALLSNYRLKVATQLKSIVSPLSIAFANYRSTITQLMTLVLPILAAHQLGVLISFVNNKLAGWQDPIWIAAIGAANTAFSVTIACGWGVIVSVGILTAKQLGKNQEITKTGLILKASFLTSFVISIPIMLILRHMQTIWLYFEQPTEIALLSQKYLDGLLWVVFIDLAKFAIYQFATAHHRITAILVSTAANIPLIYVVNSVLIKYLGIYGLGLGIAIVESVTFFALWLYCYKDKVFSACLASTASFRTYCTLALEQLKLGLSIGAMSTIELLFLFIIGLWVANISTNHSIAHHIAMPWLHFTIIIAVSFAEAITILMAKAQGQNSTRNTFKSLWAGLCLTTFCMVLFSCLYWLIPQLPIKLMLGTHGNDPNIIALSISTLAACGVFQIFDGIRIALSGALRGLSDTQYPMWVSLIAFWMVGLPIAYVCTFILEWQHLGLWCGMTCAVIVMIGLQYARIRRLLQNS